MDAITTGVQGGIVMIDEKRLIEDYDRITFTDKIQQRQIKNLIEHLIELQPKVGEWIPCSERLPEEYTEVLGCDRYGDTYIVKMYDTKIYGNVWKQWGGGELRLACIIAWQPLPKPYKG